ncbi:hypothetical protein C8R44DRAFT_745928 [Mycena epipterygia]|nr:hypothetical protein C8R44DRAFT_745928 [Mycena epipterygia]
MSGNYKWKRIRLVSAHSTNERRWARFQKTINTSLHLIQHVRQVEIIDLAVSKETFLAVCNFAFTRLDAASMTLDFPTPSSTLAVQQLLTLPTLRRLQLRCNSTDLATFSQIWDRCSPTLKHLELSYYPSSFDKFCSTQHSFSTIRLESLTLCNESVREWLVNTDCALDFSGLSTLSIYQNAELLGSQMFAGARQTIQTLDVTLEFREATLDLSSFVSLTILRIRITPRSWPLLLATLSTIPPSSRILKIVFIGLIVNTAPEQFDSILSALPIAPTIELEVDPIIYAGLITKFPLLSSKNLHRRADMDPHWFQCPTLNTFNALLRILPLIYGSDGGPLCDMSRYAIYVECNRLYDISLLRSSWLTLQHWEWKSPSTVYILWIVV